MTPSPTQPQPNLLDSTTLGALFCTTLDTLPHHPQASADEIATQREAACLVIATLRPRDPLEALLAARIVASHYQVMDDFRCAAQRDLPPGLQLRFQGRAVALSRIMDATLHKLMDRQTAAPRRPEALPVAVPAPRAQPVPEVARAGTPPTTARADTTPQAGPAARRSLPTPAPQQGIPAAAPQQGVPVAAPRQGIPAAAPRQAIPAATLEQLMAELQARSATSSAALAA